MRTSQFRVVATSAGNEGHAWGMGLDCFLMKGRWECGYSFQYFSYLMYVYTIEFLSLSAVDILRWVILCCGLSGVCVVKCQQCPGPLPTQCQQHPPLQAVTGKSMSSDIAKCPLWAKSCLVETLVQNKEDLVSEILDDFPKSHSRQRTASGPASRSPQFHPVLFKVYQRGPQGQIFLLLGLQRNCIGHKYSRIHLTKNKTWADYLLQFTTNAMLISKHKVFK